MGKNGKAAAGLVTYNAKCAPCHGVDGKKIDIYCQGLFLGEMFRKDPHEIQHKAIWGMPKDREHLDAGCQAGGGIMPAIDITDQDIRNMLVMGQDSLLFPWK
jgi:mono/diheme cytochrome c family protein